MKKNLLLMLVIAMGYTISTIGCSTNILEIEKPVYPETPPLSEEEVEDDTSPDPVGIFDYSKIGEHPRLFLSAADFAQLKSDIVSNADLRKIHDIIIDRCEKEFVGGKDLTYQLTGKRLLTVSRNALERISHLSYGYRMTGKYAYLGQIEKDIKAVCAFSDWNPSHYLDVGEMALAVAIGLDWMYDDLQPQTRQIARNALERMAFETATNAQTNGFLNSETNWNQICNGGLLLAALSMYEKDKARSVEIIEQSFNSNKTKGMTIYGNHGNYPEGYMYWGYGTTYQVMIIAALEKIFGTDGGLTSVTEGFLQTAEYMLFMSGTTGKCFNYSDAKEAESPKLPMWWFANKLNDPSLLFNEKRILQEGAYAPTSKFEERRLLPVIMGLMNKAQIEEPIAAPSKNIWWGEGTTPVVLMRTDWSFSDTDKYFGIKGGRANTSHGHMDGGTFVYDAYGERWAMDLGMQTYSPLEEAGVDLWNMEQNSTRWSIFRLNNHSHSVITINGNDYHYKGGAFIHKSYMNNLGDKLGARFECFAVNRHGTDYDVKAPLRTAELVSKGNNDHDLVITDQIKSEKGKSPLVKWAMVTPANAEIVSDKCIKLTQNGKILYLNVTEKSNNAFTLKTWPTSTGNLLDEPNPGTVIVGFEANMTPESERLFTVTLSNERKD